MKQNKKLYNDILFIWFLILDIEVEVRCLRKWLKEMERRIDPLHFSMAEQWTTHDREVSIVISNFIIVYNDLILTHITTVRRSTV